MARGEWWWVARPEQVPPPGNWFVCLALAGRGWGKAVALSTPIPTPSGFRKMGDLEIGDQVFDETGAPCTVTAVFNQTPATAYRITFSDGSTIDACSEHQWVTWEHRDRKSFLRSSHEGDVTRFPTDWANWRPLRQRGATLRRDESGAGPRIRTTQDIVNTMTYGSRGDLNHCIPVAGPLQLPDADLPIDPWLLGYWLGNGSTNSGELVGNAQDADHVQRRIVAGQFDARLTQESGGSFRGSPYGLVTLLRKLGVLGMKHVPEQYLWASPRQRMELLAGLMDSDGYGEASKVEFSSVRRELAEAVAFLARSLSQKAVLHEGRAILNGVDHGPSFRVTWRPTFNPFSSPRKAAKYAPTNSQSLRNHHRMITAVEPIDPTPMRCITVDSPNSMYLIGESMIPTHNSRAGSEWVVNQVLKHPYDNRGASTEWLVIAETLSDARTICMEGPAGILQVLNRRKIRHRYKMSPRPMVLFPSGAKIYTEGADDPDVGRGYNASGAWLDECVAEGELVTTARGAIPIEQVRIGDLALTRAGFRRVTDAWVVSESTSVIRIVTDSGAVVVTPTHLVWTHRGWKNAKDVVPGDSMVTCLRQMDTNPLSPAPSPPSMTGTANAGTSTSAWAITSIEPAPSFTGLSGSKSTARSRTATRSITSIAAGGTIAWRTSNSLLLQHTNDSLARNEMIPPGLRGDLNEPALALLPIGSGASLGKLSARSAEWFTSAPACAPSGAGSRADPPPSAKLSQTRVLAVEKVSAPAKVYDLTIDGQPEFFAGGLLVHNCVKWRTPRRSWYEGIMPSLRADLVGDHPRAFVTTTPKPIDLIQEWLKRDDGTVHLMRGSTFDNQANLSALVIQELKRRYEGTAVGRQELYGEVIEAFDGALFARLDIENGRVDDIPDDIIATVVGVDPSLTGEDDEMGIVVVSRDRQKHLYVQADKSAMAVGRAAALAAWRIVAEFGADKLVCEENLGKRWMQQVFHDAYFELVGQGLFPAGSKPPLVRIDTKIGKKTRAEPVAMRCEQGRLHMVGHMPKLEDQMSTFTGWGTNESPDRLDALVHACRYLMDGEKKEARIASPRDALSSTLQSLWQDAGSYNSGGF